MSTSPPEGARRTQAERRAATLARVLDATIESIAEIGYARTSLGEVCTRSGVSKGGLFRYVDSRTDLMIAAAQEVARRHVDAARKTVADIGREPTAEELVRVIRERIRSTENTVWFELLVAARTDVALRDGLEPVMRAMLDEVELVAREVDALAGLSDDALTLVLTTLQHTFDGEAIRRVVLPDHDLEARRLGMLVDFAEYVGTRRHE